ncbi:MAG: polysaccharide deacetylase family protein [Defluviitaleaceae bacterium]|nr:polysaccharide deacetylase family protein [Defluviitaleaceae bacterium]
MLFLKMLKELRFLFVFFFALFFFIFFSFFSALPVSLVSVQGSPLETLMGEKMGHSVKLPIIMYHVITDSPSNMWEITAEEFETDLIYLRDNGYTAITMQDVIDFVEHGKALPDRPILITFDDGRAATTDQLIPLLKKYDAKAMLAIIGYETDHYTELSKEQTHIKRHPHLTWQDVQKALESGMVEIQSHTHNLHGKTGAGRLCNESKDDYRARLTADLNKFNQALKEHTGQTANTLVYPYGIFSDCTDSFLEDVGYVASMTASEGVNTLVVGNRDCLHGLARYNRPPHISSERFFGKIK